MPTYEVTTLEPKADAMLNEMQTDQLIRMEKRTANGEAKTPLAFGTMKGLVLYITDDFDAPLDDFEEYM